MTIFVSSIFFETPCILYYLFIYLFIEVEMRKVKRCEHWTLDIGHWTEISKKIRKGAFENFWGRTSY